MSDTAADESTAADDVKYGVLLPAGQEQLRAGASAPSIVNWAIAAEQLGLDSVWAGDSLVRPRIEPLTLLTAVAQATERVTLGTAALIPAFRHPVVGAVTASSLDLLSGGRLVLGVGAGFPGFSEPEFEMVGVPFRTRFSYLDDVVALWRQLWNGSPREFHGKVLDLDWLPEVPRPHQPGGPPVWLAGITPAALDRTGRSYDGWLPYPPDPDDYQAGLERVQEVARGHGRDADGITPALFATVYIDDDPDRGEQALDRYCQATYGLPHETVRQIQAMFTGAPDEIATQLARYAGARHILFRIAALDPDVLTTQLATLPDIVTHRASVI
jgi:alkanesulfonate monooxygenase SsuD/methylene tetrahydromethanopterin reductase-like flavin-dependent oxidoreductase (luciferase family)